VFRGGDWGYAQKVKHEQKDFLAEQGVHFLYE